MLKKTAIAACLALSAIASNAADLYAMPATFNAAGDGNQGYTGLMVNTFTVNSAGLMLTHLGAFDDDKNGLSTSITVGLLDMTSSSVLRSVVLTAASHGTGNGTNWQFADVADYVLVAGRTYGIAAFGFNASNENYNSGLSPSVSVLSFNTMSGAVSKTGSYANPTASFAYTGTAFAAAASPRYGAGNAMLSPVPEAGTTAMMLLGLGTVGLVARRRSFKG